MNTSGEMMHLTERQEELWERWQRGETQQAIATALKTTPPSVWITLASRGGIAPPRRRRSRHALTLAEREEISRGLVASKSCRQIAAEIGRSPSTVSREVARNRGRRQYRASRADGITWRRGLRPKPCLLAVDGTLRKIVSQKLSQQWSPEQISNWLKDEYPGDKTMRVSHETIYRSLFIQARGALKKELQGNLRSRRKMRRARTSTAKGGTQGQIVDAVSIRDRPAEVEDRAVPGHWEGDLVFGSNNSCIATLVERQTRFVMLARLDNSKSETVIKALARQIRKLPSSLRRSLTWDRGSEMAKHKDFTVSTDVKVYFCDPRSPWQRGSNENTNGLLRQYFPKGTDISGYSQADLNWVAKRLNQRPRKTLGYKTPAYKLEQVMR